MSRVSLGDASLTNMLARTGAALRGQVQRASQEVATGQHADLGRVLRGDLTPVLAIDASLARLEAFGRAATDAATQTSAQQAALTGLSKLASGITMTLLGAGDFPTPAQVNSSAADARARLSSAIGLLNAEAGGRAIFAGAATDSLPLGSAEDLLLALEGAAAGATTAGQVAAAVNGWFASAAGYGTFYQGGTPLTPASIAPGEAADLSTTAEDPALRDTLAGLAMAALIDRGILSGNSEERARLAETSGQVLLTGEDARIALAARIGTVEAQIEDARSHTGAEVTALGILRSEFGSADPYEAATRLQTAETQLESLYLVTARVSRLSLVDFLR